MTPSALDKVLAEFKPPFKYDEVTQFIFSNNNHAVLYVVDQKLKQKRETQKALGEFLAQALNEAVQKRKQKEEHP